MTISGAGYTPGPAITVSIQLPDHTTTVLAPIANSDGTFSTVYNPPPIPGRYTITATDGVYTAKTATTQADAISVDFKQCSNENNVLGACKWINSILQGNNSRTYEGMSTLQRLILDDVPISTTGNYRMQFHMDAIKATHHAYDYITTWDQAIYANQAIAPAGLTQPYLLSGDLLQNTLAANQVACADAPNSGGGVTLYARCLALRAGGNVAFADLDRDAPILANPNPRWHCQE